VPAVADDHQVVAVVGLVVRDDLGGVAGDGLGPHGHAALARRGLRQRAGEERVPLALDVVDLAARCGVGGQPALDGRRGEPGVG
jgi:hypothetical protein